MNKKIQRLKALAKKASTKLGVISLLLVAQAASAADSKGEFAPLYQHLTDWATGSLGKSLSMVFLLVGISVGVMKGQLTAAIVAIACGLCLMISPQVIDSIFASGTL